MAGRHNPPDHRGPEAVAGLRQRRVERDEPVGRRLSDAEILLAAGADTWPEFAEGDRVRVLFSVQDPIDAVVVEPPDRNGWIKVAEDFNDRPNTFLALASCCVKLGDES